RDRDAEPAQPLDVCVLGLVATLHAIAEIVQDLGDAAHADAADPNEMDETDVERKGPHAAASWPGVIRDSALRAVLSAPLPRGISSITRSARRAAASQWAALCAQAAAWASVAGWPRTDCNRSAKTSGVKTRSGISQAAPTSLTALALAVWWSSVACG